MNTNVTRYLTATAACLWLSSWAHAVSLGGEEATPTTTAVSAAPNPATVSSTVMVEATVYPPNQGAMKFLVDGQLLATVPIVPSTGTCPDPTAAPRRAKAAAAKLNATSAGASASTTAACAPYGTAAILIAPGSLAVGDHVVTVSFAPNDPAFVDSVSSPLTLTVAPPPGTGALPAVPPASPAPITKYEYDAQGNLTKTIVAPAVRDYATKHQYDPLGRRKSTTDAKSGFTEFGYDLQDQLTSVSDPRRLVTRYDLDGLGGLSKLTSPDTGVTTNSAYDAAGNVKASTDARGVVANYDYDELSRLTQVQYSKAGQPARTVSWTYDQTGPSFGAGIGRLTTAATPDASTTFRYDTLGQVKMTVQSSAVGSPLVVNYDHDTAGRIIGITYPSGRAVSFGWANGQPKSVSITSAGTTKKLLDQVAMTAFGSVKSWTWQIGSSPKPHSRVYDSYGRLVRHPLGNLIRDITYDEADRVSGYTHYFAATGQPASAFDQTFRYDEADRLLGATGAASWSYTYDASGNRTTSSVGISQRTYSIQATSNKIDWLTNPLRSMQYDSGGNTSSDIQGTSSSNYTATYSLEGRLATMAQGSTAGVDFGYDAMGRRVVRGSWAGNPAGARTYTLFAYDQDNHLLGEYKADGTPITEYVWLGDIPVAVLKPDGTGVQIYAIHTDHLNTPQMLVDANGQVRWRWLGEPFGASPAEEQPTAGLAPVQQQLRFPGQQYEAFGGRHYNHFRDYDPTVGRYVQSDPIGLDGGINTYAYVGGNPVSALDPAGLARIVSPGFNSFGDEVKWRQKYKDLFAINQIVRDKIAKSCPQLLEKFDQWVIRVDPNIDNMAKRARGTYMTTSYGKQSSQVNKGFFDITSGESPSQLFVFSHEFRHLLKANNDLFRPGDEFRDPLTVPGEIDADAWARNFLGDRCTCEK